MIIYVYTLTVLEIYLDDTRIIILRNAIGVMDDGVYHYYSSGKSRTQLKRIPITLVDFQRMLHDLALTSSSFDDDKVNNL